MIGGLEPAIAGLLELRRIQDLKFDQWAEAIDSVISALRHLGTANCSPLLVGLAEALEDELINASPTAIPPLRS